MTVLFIVLLNLLNPEQADLVHKTYPTAEACQKAFAELEQERPAPATVAVKGFCVPVKDLTATN